MNEAEKMIQQPTEQTHCTTPLLTDVQGLHQDHDNYYYYTLSSAVRGRCTIVFGSTKNTIPVIYTYSYKSF